MLVVEVWSGEERTCGHRCELLQGTCLCVGVCGTCGFVWVRVGWCARTHALAPVCLSVCLAV